MRRFNTTGLCVPGRHYMVDVSGRVEEMRAMVWRGDYFCVNRPRQYGKTTTLSTLKQTLAAECDVASLSFQRLSHADFASEASFVRAICRNVAKAFRALPSPVAERMREVARDRRTEWVMDDLFDAFEDWVGASDRTVVLIIDEVDSATNNQVFLDFLARLRDQYLLREEDPAYPAFQSVVLAGVTDVKHLKAKIRPEDQARPNSPWNIAADFDVVMSFDEADVRGMLADYEADHATGMDVTAVADEVVAWTGGYPYLVSRICQLVDERGLAWDCGGINRAVRLLLADDDVALFESLMGQLERRPELKPVLRAMLVRGEQVAYLPYDETQKLLRMHGFCRERAGRLVVANRVFETLLCDHLLGEERGGGFRSAGDLGRSRFVRGGRLDMCAVHDKVLWEETI